MNKINDSLKNFKRLLEKFKGELGQHEIILKYLIEELSSRKGGITTKEESAEKMKQVEKYLRACNKEKKKPNIKHICSELAISERAFYYYKKQIIQDEFIKTPDKKNILIIKKEVVPFWIYLEEVARRKNKPKGKRK